MKKKHLLLSMFLFISLLSGCRPSTPHVAVTSYPIEYLVKQIGGEYVSVQNISDDTLIQRASIIDEYESAFHDADVLFYIGGLEPYMELYLDDIRKAKIPMVDLSSISAFNQFRRYTSTSLE